MTHLTLHDDDVKKIKHRLWYGETSKAIAQRSPVSMSTILCIRTGARWKSVPWPDGTTGGMSKTRRTQIAKARMEAMRDLPKLVESILKGQDAKRR